MWNVIPIWLNFGGFMPGNITRQKLRQEYGKAEFASQYDKCTVMVERDHQ
jgi:hypothetical protein